VTYGYPALALTDHATLTGVIPFYSACKENGIKPIIGLEVDVALPGGRARPRTAALVLLALDRSGWQQISRLSSSIRSCPDDDARCCTFETLAAHAQGLLCLTGGCRGILNLSIALPDWEAPCEKLLGDLSSIFPDRLYTELVCQVTGNGLSPEENNYRLSMLATKFKSPRVAGSSVYYISPDHAAYQQTAAAMRLIKPAASLAPEDTAPPASYFRTQSEFLSIYKNFPDALAATEEVASRCNLEFSFNEPLFPKIPLPPGITPAQLIRQKAEEGAIKRFGKLTNELQARIDKELDTIITKGFEPIFLIAEEMIQFTHQNGIPTASRGSASSSLIAHCLGITTPDPIALDLYFERFLNPARNIPPDIDTDFCSRRRDEVINHLFATYGEEKVAMVGTINTFKPRSALGEVAKAHGMSPSEIRPLTSSLHHRYWSRADQEDSPEQKTSPFAEVLQKHGQNPVIRQIVDQAAFFLDRPHHLSVHPGGVVIAPGPMVDYVPVARSGGKGVSITQFDLDAVEKIGLVKLDLLGIRGLTVIGDVAKEIFSWRRKEFSTPLQILDRIPFDDPDTVTIVSSGKTIGCFQIESPGMRATLKEIQARSIPDIMAALALYRPGPLKGGLRDDFVRRHNHLEPVVHLHPALAGILKETYGVILYQEQVLRIAHEVAGLSLGDSDLLRRAMSHFDPGKQMQELRKKFVCGAFEHAQVPEETAERIWEMMAAFAGYGFPKAHAASYAQVAWNSAWCKAHYPAEFLAAVLANWGGYYSQSIYLNEARRCGLTIQPPHINHSRQQFTAAYPHGDPVLYMGLDQVRALTQHTQQAILRYRPFHSLSEFIVKVDPRPIEIENLIKVSALDGIGTIPDLLHELSGTHIQPGQLSLFSSAQTTGADWLPEQKIAAQQALLGISVGIHPLEPFLEQLKQMKVISTIEAFEKPGQSIRIAGIRQSIHRSQTQKGDWMAFLTIEDMDGTMDVILFPELYSRVVRNLFFESNDPVVIEGKIDLDSESDDPVLFAQRVWPLKKQTNIAA
jgi:DNA-directed DNA polymerase III PolC